MNSVAHRLLQYLKPYLQHGFQNIRERIASTLINIYECDLDFPKTSYASPPPKIADLLKEKDAEISILLGQLNIIEGRQFFRFFNIIYLTRIFKFSIS